MKTKYYKDYRHNYLVIEEEKEHIENRYDSKMITHNQIPGLLYCQERNINGNHLLYYEITSKQNIKRYFKQHQFEMKHLRILMIHIEKINQILEKYLLDIDGIWFHPEYIYMDMELSQCFFLYYPWNCEDTELGFESLMNYLTEIIDPEDILLTEAVYKMSDFSEHKDYSTSEIITWFKMHYSEEEDMYDRNLDNRKTNKEIVKIQNIPAEDENDRGKRKESVISYEKEEKTDKDETKHMFLFQRLLKKLGLYSEKHREDNDKYDFRELDIIENTGEGYSEQENTVYIPWKENSEHTLYGQDKGNKYRIDLNKVPLTVGKLPGVVDMVLEDRSISRMHAEFSRKGKQFYITDLNSTNGTFRNGLRLNPNDCEPIEPGDEIALGKLKFVYR